MTQPKPPLKVLVAPLDWGLGHATRCIPIIRQLLLNGYNVTLAGEGKSAMLLQSNFPELDMLPLKGYNITYSKTGVGFVFRILTQIPKILNAIRNERNWLKQIQKKHSFNLVISDNRYGLKIDGLHSIIMTHQLQILSGTGTLADKIMLRLHKKVLEKFDTCWVVDNEGDSNLGGILSYPKRLPANATYIGLQSQFTQKPHPQQSSDNNQILILLSGPEPMRTQLEEKLLTQIGTLTGYHFHLVAGNPSGNKPENLPAHLDYYTHLNAEKLGIIIEQCGLVICRSGYSTLMDLAVLDKKALLIPTPGQTEQLYLGKKLMTDNRCYCVEQNKIDLSVDIPKALTYTGIFAKQDQKNLDAAVCRATKLAMGNGD